MQRITTDNDVKNLGIILSVWAHPDDETLLAGGLMAAAVKNGQEVICVTATKGEKGVQDEARWPAARLADIRTQELLASLQELGIIKHEWLDYHDGECASVPDDEAIEKLKALTEHYQPDTILTFGPEGLTGHSDHQAVSRWVKKLVAGMARKSNVYQAVYESGQYEQYLQPLDEQINMFFGIDKPPLVNPSDCAIAFEMSEATLQQKIRALAAQESQMERLLNLVPEASRKGTFGHEYFVAA